VRTKFNFLNKDEDYADLENKMKALININNEEYYAHWMLGRLYTMQEKYSDAIIEYNKTIELAPLFRPDFYYDLSFVYYQQEDYLTAKKTIYKILEIYPDYQYSSNPNLPTQLAYLYLLLGQTYEKLGDTDKAIDNINKSLHYLPEFKLAEDKLKEIQ
ncbi:MAG: tetratricopeptide repeat protein, partial [bacterium]|nr:tetratricopeptide repeat protein [bacterium]